MRKFIHTLARILAAALLAAVAGSAAAQQAFPTRPITLVVPYGPGSGNDVIARILASKMTDNWGHPVVVVNRPGATGGLALETVAKSAPDGYTIVIASTSQIINQHLSNMRYDFLRDFAPVSLAGSMPFVVAVLSTFPAKTMNDLVAVAKASPRKLNHTGTVGSIQHFMAELLKSAAKIDMVLVPTKLVADGEADVLAGRVEVWIVTFNSAVARAKAGTVRVLAVTGDKRSPELPDVPTMDEAGYPTLNIVAAYYILAPAGTPSSIRSALNREFVKAMESKDVKDRLAAAGVTPKSSTPEELGALLKRDVPKWSKIVKDSGVRVD